MTRASLLHALRVVGTVLAASVLALLQSTPVFATSPAVIYSSSLSGFLFPQQSEDCNFHTVLTLHNLPAVSWMLILTAEIDERSDDVSGVTGQTTCRIAS